MSRHSLHGITRILAVVAIWASGAASPAWAEPAFAVRTGYRCSQCHMNRTGGGVRTAFGSIYTQTVLPHRLLSWREGENLLPANPDARINYGADVRLQALSTQPNLSEDTFSFEVPEANVYLEARLLPGRLSLYVDEELGPGGASARELFGLWSLKKARGYFKFGKFLPPFGWRLPDDNAFIRQFSGFTYSAPDVGMEFGIEPGKWSLHLAIVNGASGGGENNSSKQVSTVIVRRFGNARVGVSGSNNIGGGARTTQAGFFAGLNLGRLALIGEGDWRELRRGGQSDHSLLGLFEADLLLSRGLNLKLAHDYIDPDRDIGTDDRVRDSLGIEFIPYPFVQFRLFGRLVDGPPQVQSSRDTQVVFEIHIFL